MAHQSGVKDSTAAYLALLVVTVIGTMSNNIVSVPLRDIATDLDESVQATVLTVLAFSLVLAVSLPLAGWLGDRFGRKRVLVLSIVVLALGQVLAALSPNLPMLVVARGIQGLGCSGIPPLVMALLVSLHPDRTARMMAAWATANGVGQAVGPPVGGIITDVIGWRWIFAFTATASVITLWVIARTVPSPERRDTRLHVAGALLLTCGVAVLLSGVSALSQIHFPRMIAVVLVAAGLCLLVGFIAVSHGNPDAMVPLRLIVETRFLRSAFAGFAHMFALGTALVAVPLFLTGPIGLSTSAAGTLFFVLPVTMTICAPLVGRLASREAGPRPALRAGLVLIMAGAGLFITLAERTAPSAIEAAATLGVLGAGIAFVQTPAATGANRSPAGRFGAALGLYNLVRFSGSTVGAAWVALLSPQNLTVAIYGGVVSVALMALLLSFMGPNPPAAPAAPT